MCTHVGDSRARPRRVARHLIRDGFDRESGRGRGRDRDVMRGARCKLLRREGVPSNTRELTIPASKRLAGNLQADVPLF